MAWEPRVQSRVELYQRLKKKYLIPPFLTPSTIREVLYSRIHIYIYIYTNISGKIVSHNDDFNEQTNTLLYKNIISQLYSRKGDIGCARETSWRRGQTVILTQSSSFDYSSTSSSSWLGCSTVGQWGPKAPSLSLNSASCIRLTQAVCVLVILLFNIHLLPLFFRLFTQLQLLIDGSVEGQYVIYVSRVKGSNPGKRNRALPYTSVQ